MRAISSTLIFTLTTLVAACATAKEPAMTTTSTTTKTATVSHAPTAAKRTGYSTQGGIRYYYEVHGSGEPLLLLHGGLMSIDTLGPILPALAAKRQVIAVDLLGHGRTELGDRSFELDAIADDITGILGELGLAQVDALGYSLGAGISFRIAVRHPTKIRRLALVSAAFARDGFYAEMLAMQAQVGARAAPMMKDTPMYKTYAAVAPHPDDFPRLLDKIGAFMRTPYNWADDVKKLQMPVMLVWGDSDMMRPEHMVEFYKLLGGGQRDAGWAGENMSKNRLAILPGVTHYNITESPALPATVLPFLDATKSDVTSGLQVAKH
jgi:pimeloyl-ACP methyl ester carboxylesterase